jgi:hypothetical protein
VQVKYINLPGKFWNMGKLSVYISLVGLGVFGAVPSLEQAKHRRTVCQGWRFLPAQRTLDIQAVGARLRKRWNERRRRLDRGKGVFGEFPS